MRVVVVGASAGGVEALQRLLGSLPPDLAATVLVVLHLPPHGRSSLSQILARACALPVAAATHDEVMVPGTVRIAPPDQHLLVQGDRLRLFHGPRENGHRPAIDPLFRSAARSHGRDVIGVILSGSLDDGTAGLHVIKARGGLALVQAPDDAAYDSMPQSAIRYVAVDEVAPAVALGRRLGELAATPRGVPTVNEPPPHEILPEDTTDPVETAEQEVHAAERVGQPSPYSCPHCHGVLWGVHDGPLLRFRCRVGHAYTAESLLAAQRESAEGALWAAYRALEENASAARRLEDRATRDGHALSAERYRRRADDALTHARILRQILAQDEPNDASSAEDIHGTEGAGP